ncbi:rhamnosyltransferase WsaF family glycosyltransferase [Leifsonia sp. 2MCAF36]|uniref:rhamnosyltransferase WsaF family glycosyltransferase n=1 Tax=Leifsonia sp. 2MCAF36 TaxID=3232988 RepID=UPI003F966DEA
MNPVTRAYRTLSAAGSHLAHNGVKDVVRRVAKRFYQAVDAADLEFPLLPADVADSSGPGLPVPSSPRPAGAPATIGWICVPPAAGSGGHTTFFRMVAALERQGHTCVIYLYDRHKGVLENHARVIREAWPEVKARIASVDEGFEGVDAVVASSWPTAHVLATRTARVPVHRFYFLQDYEPYFYPRGSLYALAEDTYRFDFTRISLGPMIADTLRSEVGVDSHIVEFGCDSSVYRLLNTGPRMGVAFYERRETPRRGFELARLGLEEFHRRHPEQPVHLYGGDVSDWSIPVVRHGRLTPVQLNELYNTCVAGLAMSFTNISLVSEEMLAAGAVPVMNDSPLARANLSHPEAVWARPTPAGIADALSAVVESTDPERPARAATGVRKDWRDAEGGVARLILGAVYGHSADAAAEASAAPVDAGEAQR